jgi:hypothetical protein
MSNEIQFPHCDPRILHTPGSCAYCDESGLQPVREVWGIAFTDKPEEGKTPCPALVARGDSVNRWHGNVARPSLDSVANHLLNKENDPDESGGA